VSEQKHAITAAQEMTAALNGLSKRLDAAESYGRRNRRLIAITIVSMLVDVALTVAVTVALVGVHHNAATVSQLHGTSVSACRLGNQTRAANVALWDHVAAISQPRAGESTAQRRRQEKTTAAFLTYVRKVWASRNCQSLYRLGHP
jgi:hypothetical protein